MEKVEDTSPPGVSLTGQFTDVSQVEKFELSEAEYAARRDTVLAYKQRNKLGRFAASGEAAASSVPATDAKLDITVGQRCEVVPNSEGGIARRGSVRFVGPTEFGTGQGVWVGVQYDEPVGKNDGTCVHSFISSSIDETKGSNMSRVNGKSYFSCPAPYGGFVRPEKVRVGDFPPIDLDDELEEM